MSTLQQLKPQLVNALVSAFDANGLDRMLQFECKYGGLDTLSPEAKRYPDRVLDVVNDAVRRQWLDELVQGATKQNGGNRALKSVAEQVLSGIEAQGDQFYPDPNFELTLEGSPAVTHHTTIHVDGDSSAPIIVGDGATTVGERGVNVGGSVGGDIITGDGDRVNKTYQSGDNITVGNITGSTGVAIGRNATANVTITNEQKSEFDQLVTQLERLLDQVEANRADDAADVRDEVEELKEELAEDNPTPRKVKKYSGRLLEAAGKFATTVPAILTAAEKITKFVQNLT